MSKGRSRATVTPAAPDFHRVRHFGYSPVGTEVCLYCAVMFDPGEMRYQLVDTRFVYPMGAILPLHLSCARARKANPPPPRERIWHQ
jgi:hypothetical protein